MFDRLADVRGKRSAVPSIQGSRGIRAGALRRKERLQASRSTCGDGAAADAAGFRHFPGLGDRPNGPTLYVRQLRDAKIKPLVETFDAEVLDLYAMVCGWVLARAHSKVSELSSTISGYLGASSDVFDKAMGSFALAYADQAEHDYAALKAAVRRGKITVYQEAA